MTQPVRSGQRLKRWATAPLVLLAALLIFLEEFLWDQLANLFGLLARLPFWARLERWVAGLPAWAALPMFLVPMVLLFPIKLAALWLIGHHHVVLGLQVILAAKIGGTAIAARLFMLLKPTLLTVPWFARGYAFFLYWRERIFTRLHAMWWWQTAHQGMVAIRARFAAWRAGGGGFTRRLQRWRKYLAARRKR
ncbi:hypothetical protein [Chitinimonas naiadis]